MSNDQQRFGSNVISVQALEKANQAKTISGDATVKVREAINSVNDILIALNNMGSIGTLISRRCVLQLSSCFRLVIRLYLFCVWPFFLVCSLPDTAALDELERKLAAAEKDFAESDLDRRLEEMRGARGAQVWKKQNLKK